MSSETVQVLISLLFPLVLLVITYLIGAMLERRHFADLRVREERFRSFPTVTFATLPAGWEPTAVDVAHGSVVVSLDYFKRFIASLRALIGGRIKSYEPLLDRARREASLRMIEDATRRGFHAVVNVRLETSRMASARRDGKGTAGIEILAYGTALKLANPPA
jgi:uncharacterized protein YbjQ (UPF0145 family)